MYGMHIGIFSQERRGKFSCQMKQQSFNCNQLLIITILTITQRNQMENKRPLQRRNHQGILKKHDVLVFMFQVWKKYILQTSSKNRLIWNYHETKFDTEFSFYVLCCYRIDKYMRWLQTHPFKALLCRTESFSLKQFLFSVVAVVSVRT